MLLRKEQSHTDRVYNKQLPPVRVSSWSASGTDLTIVFDQVVILSGTPKYTTDIAATAVSAAKSGPETVVVTFDADISLASQLTIPFEDPAIRNQKGGFVTSSNVAA